MRSEPSKSEKAGSGKPDNASSRPYVETAAFDASAASETPDVSRAENRADPPALNTPTLDPSDSIGRFRVEKEIGHGGMGTVYLAHDTQLERPVALKVPKLGGDTQATERFLREARAAATLCHPNICPIFDVGQQGEMHYIAMGFIEGRPLAHFIVAGRRQSEQSIASVVRKIAVALEEAHSHGIVHRDLKPANIMIDRRGEPIIMDFGLACRVDDPDATRLTQEGTLIGTPAYMSPEQIDDRQAVGPASDIYSLGVVLYELLTGRCPFSGSVVSVIGQVLHKEPAPIAGLRPDVSPAMVAICRQAMAKDPTQRFASMKDIADALTAFLKGEQITAPKVTAQPIVEKGLKDLLDEELPGQPAGGIALLPLPRSRRNRLLQWPVVAAAAAIAVVVGVMLAVTLSGSHPADSGTASLSGAGDAAPAAKDEPLQRAAAESKENKAQSNPAPSAERASVKNPQSSDAPLDPPLGEPGSGKLVLSGEPPNNNVMSQGGPAGDGATPPENPSSEQPPPDGSPALVVPVAPSGAPKKESPDQKLPGAPVGDAPSPGDPPVAEQPRPPKEGDTLADQFRRADHNHDGKLDRGEMPLHIIHRADRNKDEALTLDELEAAHKKRGDALFSPPTAAELRRLPRRGGPPGGPPPFGNKALLRKPPQR